MNMATAAGFPASGNASTVFHCEMGETVVDGAFSKENTHQHLPIYYLTSFKYGDEEIKPKLPGTDPISKEDKPVVGAFGEPQWLGCGYEFTFGLYTDTAAQSVMKAQNNKGKTIPVEIQFEAYEYNPNTKKYFKSAWSDAPLKAVVVGAPPHPKSYSGIREADVFYVPMRLLFKDDGEKQTMNIAYDEEAKDTILVSEPRSA